MLRKISLSIIFACQIVSAQTTDLVTPLGKTLISIDSSKRVSWNSTTFNYAVGSFGYTGEISKKSHAYSLNYKTPGFYMNYSTATLKDVVSLNFGGASFVSEDFNHPTAYQMFLSKLFIDKREAFEYKTKGFSLGMSHLSGTGVDVTSYSLQSKTSKLDYVSANKSLLIQDAWARPYATKKYISAQYGPYSAKIMDQYTDIQATWKNMSFKTVNHPTRDETSFSYRTKSGAFSYTEFDDVYTKRFLAYDSNGLKINVVTDGPTTAGQFVQKSTTVAFSEDQAFVKTTSAGVDYKISREDGDLSYDVKKGSLGVKNGEAYGSLNLAKGLNTTMSMENGVEQVSYAVITPDKTNISFKYNNKFDVYDFYFKQNVFSVYDNSFSLIGKTKSQYKDSFSLNVSNARFRLASDVINDIYTATLSSGQTGFMLIKDQKQNYAGLTNTSKSSSLTLQYNLKIERIDRIVFNYAIKF